MSVIAEKVLLESRSTVAPGRVLNFRLPHQARGFTVVLALLAPPASVAQVLEESARATENYVFFTPSVGVVSGATERAIAELSRPVPLFVKTGQTVREAVVSTCPTSSANYQEILQSRFSELNSRISGGATDLESPMVSDRFFLVPDCYGRSFIPTVVRDGESVWDIRKRLKEYGFDAPAMSWSEYERGTELASGIDLSDNVAAGSVVYVPPAFVKFSTADPASAQALANTLRQEYGEISVSGPLSGSPPTKGDSALIDGNIDSQCMPSNLTSVLDYSFGMEGAVSGALMRSEDRGEQFRKVTSIILDGGLQDSAVVASERLISKGRNIFWSGSNEDVNWRDIIFAPKVPAIPLCSAESMPWELKEQGGHAFAVESVARGGAIAAISNARSGVIDTIPLNIHSLFIPDGQLCYDVVPDVGTALSTLAQLANLNPDFDVLMMSQSFNIELPPALREFFDSNKLGEKLVVVSAGNGDVALEDLPYYPAVYGGDEDKSLLVAAALDGSNKILSSSSYSKVMVDIGTLGCNVPVLRLPQPDGAHRNPGDEVTVAFASGTSFAAPRVAYVAGLIYSHFDAQSAFPSAVDVKRRIIYSSDISRGLMDFIKDGRILNERKALNLSQDVLEFSDSTLSSGNVEMGEIGSSQASICPDFDIEKSSVRKMTRLSLPEESPDYLIYYEDSSGKFGRKRCNDFTSKVYFCRTTKAKCDSEDLWEPVELADWKDIVFSMRRQ